jgi:outer membrane protein assembly factor BamB
MFRGDLRNTGCRSSEKGLGGEGSVDWKFETSAPCQADCQTRGSDAIWGSPAVADGMVYIGSYDGHLYAVETESGRLRWDFKADDIVDSTPMVANGSVYFGSYGRTVYAVDAQTGTKEWTYDANGIVRCSPKVVDGICYVGTHCGFAQCAGYKSPPDSRNRGEFLALDATDGGHIWSLTTFGNVISTPAIEGNNVYFATKKGWVYCMNRFTGVINWKKRIQSTGFLLSSIAIVKNSVVVSETAGIFALDKLSGEIEWVYDGLNGDVTSSPAICSDTLYLGSNPQSTDRTAILYAISMESGKLLWKRDVPGDQIGSSPALVDGTLYFGSHNIGGSEESESKPGLFAIDTTGEVQWRHLISTGKGGKSGEGLPSEGGFGSSPAVVDGRLYIGGIDGILYSFS